MRETRPVEAKQWNDRLEDITRYLSKLERFRQQIDRDIQMLQTELPQTRGYTDPEALVIKLSVQRQLEHEEKLARQLLEHLQEECARLEIPIAGELLMQAAASTFISPQRTTSLQ